MSIKPKKKPTIARPLKKIFLSSNWEEVKPKSHLYSKRGQNKDIVSVGFYVIKKDETKTTTRVNIRIGTNVISKLSWKENNKIVVFQDKDDIFNFKLVKTENGTGYTLKPPSGTLTSFMVSFQWPHLTVPLDDKRNKIVEHEIFNGNILVFRV